MRPSVLSVLHASVVRSSMVPVALLPAVALLTAGCDVLPLLERHTGRAQAAQGRPAAAGGARVAVRPRPARVPRSASGRYAVVPGAAPARPGRGTVVRYLVEVERGLPFDRRTFAAQVHRTLNDPRGWARFQRVDHGPVRLRVALSSPALTDLQCLPLDTAGRLSCWNGLRSVINALRWARGVPQYEGDLAAYRSYLVNHEVGHGLGHGHSTCPAPGRLAPVMVQQSMSLGRCRPNPWPYPSKRG
ncbi:DUF3152 domain-containing protein [Nonomuraea muscovyensis]|uniref:DUF3152 domain-containing protein n=1 Tax=Nonomuraea muscovyensis TaxID=1124761 RepID=A0A7X0CCM0_9ACTN|nr:DUF3152 domain-containing protein [Nonomuraea muscovyensis]MBB6352238.1 hypothetical protein [Nonomuraea muscovyensis]